jgi:hypothetical protein
MHFLFYMHPHNTHTKKKLMHLFIYLTHIRTTRTLFVVWLLYTHTHTHTHTHIWICYWPSPCTWPSAIIVFAFVLQFFSYICFKLSSPCTWSSTIIVFIIVIFYLCAECLLSLYVCIYVCVCVCVCVCIHIIIVYICAECWWSI